MLGNCSFNWTMLSQINKTNNNITNNLTTRNTSSRMAVSQATYISMVILGVLVVLENSLVCLAFAFNRKLRKRQANILVCSQAGADLINGLIFIPVNVAENALGKQMHSGYVIMYVLFVSLFNLFCLALDRYLALIKPLMHHLLMDVSRTKKILIIIWLVPLAVTLIPLSWASASGPTAITAHRIYIAIFWSLMLLLCVVMVLMYIRIYRTAAKTIRLRQQRMTMNCKDKENRVTTTRKELRVAHLFGLLLFFFILAYLPILYMNFMDLVRLYRLIPPILEDLSLYSLIANSIVNPILCLLLKKDYQLIIKRWICFEWITEKRRGESLRSHTSLKTGVEDMETSDSGTEINRKKRLRLSWRKSLSVKCPDHFKMTCPENAQSTNDKTKRAAVKVKCIQMNGNCEGEAPVTEHKRQKITFEDDYLGDNAKVPLVKNKAFSPNNRSENNQNLSNEKVKFSNMSCRYTKTATERERDDHGNNQNEDRISNGNNNGLGNDTESQPILGYLE
eukprot:Seg382.2 transcript_id=Seg382.2/GoldUCD/mRNA.D3Y31 product="Adenosine receptor A2a" protein_id=Seg382.2/GoldUCD/D3Y31